MPTLPAQRSIPQDRLHWSAQTEESFSETPQHQFRYVVPPPQNRDRCQHPSIPPSFAPNSLAWSAQDNERYPLITLPGNCDEQLPQVIHFLAGSIGSHSLNHKKNLAVTGFG